MKHSANSVLFSLLLGMSYISHAQKTETITLKKEKLIPYDVSIKEENYKGKAAIVLEQPVVIDNQKTFALLQGVDFHNGSIEATISGQVGNSKVEGARGFVGIVFR